MTSTQENSELIKLKKLYHKTTKIFGPPGTGKTYTLIERVLKNYLRKGVQPSDIAYLSFTNKAVNTAVKRAMESFPNYSTEDFLRFKTLHTYCRRYFSEDVFDPKHCAIDFALDTKIIKTSDQRLDDDNFMYKDWSLGIYSKSRNLLISPEEAYKRENYKKDSLTIFQRKIATYEHYKEHGGDKVYIDFDDMIEKAIALDFPKLKVLILDEAQDCTPLQWSVIYKMADKVDRIYLAGDDDQGIYKWNGADPKYFTKFFPGRKVKLRKTQRFGEAVYKFSQVIRRGITDSEEKEYEPGDAKGYVKSYLSFREIPFEDLKEDWYILGRVHETVNELRMLAKDAGLYYKDNKETKCFDVKQWEAIKAWTTLTKGKTINKKQAKNMYKFVRELEKPEFRSDKFWSNEPDLKDYNFDELQQWCGLQITEEEKSKPWYWMLRRNFKPKQVRHFIRLLRRYGQKELDKDPLITIDTIHSVKGGEANHVVLYSKGNYPSDYDNKDKQEKSDERKVWYTGATRAKKTLHLLRTDYKFNYPIGSDYLIYVQEKNEQ
jgi:superfamily I DNA/RNA helicase|tara:strand:- start:17 stop:1654 length:1638 start_codon:yes stop_codon:yes gene_type:complete